MILSDTDIKKALHKGNIVIKPPPDFESQLSSCSLDLRLGNEFCIFQYPNLPFIDFKKSIPNKLIKNIRIKNNQYFVVPPREFVLGTTLEWIELPETIAARLEGRSSIGRLGVIVHSTASLIDPGFRGHLVLELGNLGKIPVALRPKMRICSLSFERLTTPAEIPYYKKKGAKYVGQTKPIV